MAREPGQCVCSKLTLSANIHAVGAVAGNFGYISRSKTLST